MSQDPVLTIERATGSGATYLRIRGALGGDFDPAGLLDNVEGDALLLHLRGVTPTQSGGAGKWREVLSAFSKRVERVILLECSRTIVTELNLAPDLAATLVVASAEARHVCRECNAVTKVVYDFTGNQEYSKRGIKQGCGRCGRPTVVDETLPTYFSFRQQAPADPLNARVLKLINRAQQTLDRSAMEVAVRSPQTAVAGKARAQHGDTRTPSGLWARWKAMGIAPRTGIATAVVTALAVIGVATFSADSDPTDAPRLSAKETPTRPAAKRAMNEESRTRILTAFRDGKYVEIIELMEDTDASQLADVQVAFAIGESFRLTNRLGEAESYYRIVADSPSAGRMQDDAIFWRAESLLLNGKVDQAIPLFQRIAKQKRGAFVASAKRRLAAIRRASKGAGE